MGIPVAAVAGGGADELDRSFGLGGVVLTRDPNGLGIGALAVTGDGHGRALVAGTRESGNFTLLRYRRDGSLDTGFGSEGQAEETPTGTGAAAAMAVQHDAKIVLVGVGEGEFSVGRYQPHGRLDRSFGRRGVVNTVFSA